MNRLLRNEPAYIGVIGLGEEDERATTLAFEAGRLIGARGAVLICGGLGGVMNAAARGAKEAGGTTIGILPDETRAGASRFLDFALPTGFGHGRNIVIVHSSDGLVAVGGGYGTLSEIALALKAGKPVVGLNTWDLCKEGKVIKAFESFESPVQAVKRIFALVRQRQRG